MSNLMGMLTTIQSYVWGPPTLLLLIGTGLYFTIKLRGLQITKFQMCIRDSRRGAQRDPYMVSAPGYSAQNG